MVLALIVLCLRNMWTLRNAQNQAFVIQGRSKADFLSGNVQTATLIPEHRITTVFVEKTHAAKQRG